MTALTDVERAEVAVRSPGVLILGPTTTSGGLPYGGIKIGPHRDGEIVWHSEPILTRDPASGRVVEIGRGGAEYPEIYCLIEGARFDEDVLLAGFTRATRGSLLASTSPVETRIEGTVVPSLVAPWPPLLFAPLNPKSPAYYLRRPIPTLSLRDAVAISQEKRAGLPLRFIPSPDDAWSSIPDWQACRLENLTL